MLSRSIDAQCSFTDNVSHGSGRSCTTDPSPKYQDDQHTPLSQSIPCWGWIPGLCMSNQSALSYSLLSENVLKLRFCALTQIYLIRVLGAGPRNLFSWGLPRTVYVQASGWHGMGCPVAGGFPRSWVPWTSSSSWLVFRVFSKLPGLVKYSSVPIFHSGHLQRLQLPFR